jgi:hypothetical protein
MRLDVDNRFGTVFRLYDFDEIELAKLWRTFANLASGLRHQVPLHELPFLEARDGCRLTLASGDTDCGLQREQKPDLFRVGSAVDVGRQQFRCELKRESWNRVAGTVARLLETPGQNGGSVWLQGHWGGTGEACWLLSLDGEW